MRIVGGRLSGRRFRGPPGERTRPTSERVREALASALDARARFVDASVLDLYAGTGALAFEALSRGARAATLVERDPKVHAALAESARELGLASAVTPLRLDLARDGDRARIVGTFDLVFCDPPYADVDASVEALGALARRGVFAADVLVVLEHARKQPPRTLGQFAQVARYEYGDTSVAFLTRAEKPAP